MLRALPTSVNFPLQVIADHGLLEGQRMTLLWCYALCDKDGLLQETPTTMEPMRRVDKNSVRRHMQVLEEAGYIVPIHRAARLGHIPVRELVRGYALTLRPDGGKFDAAHPRARIGTKVWAAEQRKKGRRKASSA